MKYRHIAAELYEQPWAITHSKLAAIKEAFEFFAEDHRFSDEEVRARIGAAKSPSSRTAGAVAVLPIFGIISKRVNMMSQISGGTSIEKLTASFRQCMGDPSVKAIVFDVDSPGGGVDGVPELAAEMFAARGQKKMVAVANTMMASAAYWLASCADEIVVTPSGQVGSIGVLAMHQDSSEAEKAAGIKTTLVTAGKYKSEGSDPGPLSDDARADLQAKVDEFYGMFTSAVAKNRGVSVATAKGEQFGEGRMVLSSLAVKRGMADRVATLDQTLARFGVSTQGTTQRLAANEMRERELALYR